jgi:Flp pilus assembly protein TadD
MPSVWRDAYLGQEGRFSRKKKLKFFVGLPMTPVKTPLARETPADYGSGDADIRGNLGLTLARLGRTAEAVEELDEALRLNPNSAEAHNNLGLVLLASGKAEESIPHFSTAIRLKPELAVARDNLKRAQTQINTRR